METVNALFNDHVKYVCIAHLLRPYHEDRQEIPGTVKIYNNTYVNINRRSVYDSWPRPFDCLDMSGTYHWSKLTRKCMSASFPGIYGFTNTNEQ